jgi:hypothetical protein
VPVKDSIEHKKSATRSGVHPVAPLCGMLAAAAAFCSPAPGGCLSSMVKLMLLYEKRFNIYATQKPKQQNNAILTGYNCT